MPRSRAYTVLLVSVAVLSALAPYGSPIFGATPMDAAIDTVFWFVKGAAAWCVGADLRAWFRSRTKARA